MFTNIEQIKSAIAVEKKHKYINIQGKTKKFSQFMLNEIMHIYKASKRNPKWKIIMEAFKLYSTDTMPVRKKTVDRFIKMVNKEMHPEIQLTTKALDEMDIVYLKGIGPKIGNAFNKLGIYTVLDLLFYFPKRHVDYSNKTYIKNLQEGEIVTISGYISSVNAYMTKKNLSILKVQITDESGRLDLNFFYSKTNRVMFERYKKQFPLNAEIMVSGEVKRDNYTGKLTIDKPQYSIISIEKSEDINIGRIVPIYSLSESLNLKILRKAVYTALSMYKNNIETVLPKNLIEKYNLMEKRDAVYQMHFPETIEKLEQARYTLVFEEFYLIQLNLALQRELNKQKEDYIPLKLSKNGLVEQFIKALPFELTTAQKRAIDDILRDLNSKTGMHRLLQGDVGSGKTVVATIMLLAAIENGYQGAIMAPTEILAQQHYNNLINWLTPLGISVGLFLGSNTKKQREKVQTDLLNGQTRIAVGTHALIQEDIKFNNLGAIVVDEQHRFGVKQRNALKNKSMNPQMLTMTATPIPRTLALTVHGDLDLTIIDELPKGRKAIKTYYVSSFGRDVIKLIREEISNGHQAYIVFPLIDESETLSAKAATIEAERLQNEIFPDYKIGLLHGKLKNKEKEEVMSEFKEKKYDILVSTTVVEVGVDVPNATVMVIENAERFGLSQLHQLRGRVGRSEKQSYCILVSSSRSEDSKVRLKIMEQTNDGFVIAEQDLALRGPGEFLGVRQSGLPDLVISDIVKDAKILEIARKEAINTVTNKDMADINQLLNSHFVFKSCASIDLINSG